MKLPFRPVDRVRLVSGGSARPGGFLPGIRKEVERLLQLTDGIAERLNRPLPPGEPAVAIGRHVFNAEEASFPFDVDQEGIATVDVQYVLRDGVTHQIPIMFPPPGVFRARYLKLVIRQRVAAPRRTNGTAFSIPGVQQVPVLIGNIGGVQTRKFSYGGTPLRRPLVNFLWNIVDTKSGNQLSDQLMPDTLLLPQASAPTAPIAPGGGDDLGNAAALPVPFDGSSTFLVPSNLAPAGGLHELQVPWLFERDAQLAFLFRPITPMLQPTPATTGVWRLPVTAPDHDVPAADAIDDIESGRRNNAVTVQVELHGTRHFDEQDRLRVGALSRDD